MFGDGSEPADSGFETVPDSPSSGMERAVGDGGPVVVVPARPVAKRTLEEVQFEDEEDETLSERLWGLTEMFPDSVRKATVAMHGLMGKMYGVSRTLVWVFFSSATILAAPVILELERVNMNEMAKQQQREILLGPSAAVASGHK